MSIAGLSPAPLDTFGSLVTYTDLSNLPPGVSPDCQDIQFVLGGVKTRDGLLAVLGQLAGGVNVNGLKTNITPAGAQRTLVLDSKGNLYREFNLGSLQLLTPGLVSNSYLASASLFGREYCAFSNLSAGVDVPRQYDDSFNFDRVSQMGPGEPPNAADTIANISSITRTANVVTVTTVSAHNLLATDQAVIAGVTGGATSFNGTFAVASISSSTVFTYAQTGGNESGNPNTGTANPLGNIAPGTHQVSVIFKTRQGYLTAPAPIPSGPASLGSWTAAGSRKVTLTNIPTGPSNVVARIVCFTGAGGASFFYVPATMVIADNTTTSLTVDFSDTILLAGANVDYLFKLVELGECAGVIGYASRLFWWGERAKQNNWVNLTFDGGWDPSGNGRPLGWQRDATFGAGSQREQIDAAWAESFRIVADGATATRGLITETAVQDSLGVARIQKNVDYSVRARVKRSANLTAGTLHVHLFSASGGINTTGLQVTAASATTTWTEFVADLTTPLATIPADLVLRVYADGTPGPNGESFLVDSIEIFSTNQPVNGSLVRASRVEDPESYDGVNGIMNVAENNGQSVRSAFVLRGNLYFVKDRSLHMTADDGVNEPALWSITEVSRKIGTLSVQGADVGDDFAVLAGREGLHYFDGGEPQKLSTEIQATWDSINWAAGSSIWVKVDQQSKRILVGVPLGLATQPNVVLALDYREGFEPPVHVTFAGTIKAHPQSRKWTRWNIAANSAGIIERSDGTAKVFFGTNAANGKIYQLTPGQLSDDGATIAS
jgi:hypothetical protein